MQLFSIQLNSYCSISHESQDNGQRPEKEGKNKVKRYDGHWHNSPQFCIQAFLFTSVSLGVKVLSQVFTRGAGGGKGGPPD